MTTLSSWNPLLRVPSPAGGVVEMVVAGSQPSTSGSGELPPVGVVCLAGSGLDWSGGRHHRMARQYREQHPSISELCTAGDGYAAGPLCDVQSPSGA
jgi:hypothetical protein